MANRTVHIAFTAAQQFNSGLDVRDLSGFGNGNINSTFLVTTDAGRDVSQPASCFILQRINTKVFHQPERVIKNMRIVSTHVISRLRDKHAHKDHCFKIPCVISANDGCDYWRGPEGSFWRAISYMENAESFDVIKDSVHAEEAGRALGMFHSLVSDLPPDILADTLPGFHITPRYLQHFNEVMAKRGAVSAPEERHCVKFILKRASLAGMLENARTKGELFIRTVHGDPKVNNIMFDKETGRAAGIVDLDTVKPGLVHYDIGDCIRSCCNLLGEETGQWEKVRFDTDFCRAFLRGYISAAKGFLTENDYKYIYDSIRLLAFELGLRFFTDYLEGNVYFRTTHPEHNLARALVQFRLTESIESQEPEIRAIVREYRV